MCLSWGSWVDCVPLRRQAWEGQSTMEEMVIEADTWMGPEKRKKENESLVSSAGTERTQVPRPGWRVGFRKLLDFLMSTPSGSSPQAGSQASFHQSSDEAWSLIKQLVSGSFSGWSQAGF